MSIAGGVAGPAQGRTSRVYGYDQQIRFMAGCYTRHSEEQRSGYRSGLFDAAHMADAIAQEIAAEHTVRGRLTKQGKALEAVAKRVGAAVWRANEDLHSPTKRAALAEAGR